MDHEQSYGYNFTQLIHMDTFFAFLKLQHRHCSQIKLVS